MGDHLFSQFGVGQNFFGLANRFIGDITVKFDDWKPFGFDIDRIDRIGIDDNRTTKVNGFKEGIDSSKTLRWYLDQTG